MAEVRIIDQWEAWSNKYYQKENGEDLGGGGEGGMRNVSKK